MTTKAPAAGEEVEKKPEAEGDEKPEEKKPGAEAKGDAEKGGKKNDDEKDPEVNSGRWKEVYYKWKRAEEKSVDLEKDVDALRTHSKKMEARLLEISEKKADKTEGPRPDPATDPEAYAKWVDLQYQIKEKKAEEARATQRLEDKRDVAEGLFDDYNEVVAIAERDMARDPELHKKIWSASNPFIAAYKYAKAKDKTAKDHKENADKGHVEGGGTPEGEEEDAPEVDEKEARVIRNLFPETPFEKAKEKYLSSRKKMYGR